MALITRRRFVWQVLDSSAKFGLPHRLVDNFLLALILANALVVILETVPALAADFGPAFRAFEYVSVAVFSIEYALRLWACVEDRSHNYRHRLWGRLRYSLSPLAIIDLIAIAPFYLAFLVPVDLRILRVIRIFRLLKLTRYSPALMTLGAVVRAERRSLIGAFVLMAIAIILASTIMYHLEHEAQREDFASIPDALWWGVVTLSTVGYGDVTPITPLGKILGGLITLMGLATFALPAGILAAGFANEFQQRNFVLSVHRLSEVPLFAGLEPTMITQIATVLVPLDLPARYQLLRRGDPAEAMYILVRGELELTGAAFPGEARGRQADGSIHVGPGKILGEAALLSEEPDEQVDATTLSPCKLLALYADEFAELSRSVPELRRRIQSACPG